MAAANPDVIRWDFWEGADPGANLGRIVGADGTLVVTGQIISWSCVATDKTAFPNVTLATISESGVTGLSYFDTLQYNDGYWRHNNKGYNFRHYFKLSDFTTPPPGDHMVWFEYRIVTGAHPAGWGNIDFRREGLARARQA